MSNALPQVTVIIPCYNAAEFLDETIRSVTQQSYPEWECIVMDDESSDNSLEIAHRWEANFSQIRVQTGPNKGRAAVINEALQMLGPETHYLAYLDADDMLHPEFLQVTVDYMESNPHVGLTSVGFYGFEGDISTAWNAYCNRMIPGRFLPRALRAEETRTPFITFFCGTGSGPFSLHRRSVFDRVSHWESAMTKRPVHGHEDTDMFCQFSLISEVHFLPNRLYYKREHSKAATQNHQGMQDSYTLLRKKWDRLAQSESTYAADFKLSLEYYQKVHRPLRNLKVALKAIKVAFKGTEPGVGRFAMTLVWENIPRILVGYPWFLLRFHHRRSRLRHPEMLG
ncbi:MAG: hypothetical protein SynsKO_12880 [Synoicihabitans sp.]